MRFSTFPAVCANRFTSLSSAVAQGKRAVRVSPALSPLCVAAAAQVARPSVYPFRSGTCLRRACGLVIRLQFACSWRSIRGGSEVLNTRVVLKLIFIIACVWTMVQACSGRGRVVSLCECKNQRKSSLRTSKPKFFSGQQAHVTGVRAP